MEKEAEISPGGGGRAGVGAGQQGLCEIPHALASPPGKALHVGNDDIHTGQTLFRMKMPRAALNEGFKLMSGEGDLTG